MRAAISADCTGEPPGELIDQRHRLRACRWRRPSRSRGARAASFSRRPRGRRTAIDALQPEHRDGGTVSWGRGTKRAIDPDVGPRRRREQAAAGATARIVGPDPDDTAGRRKTAMIDKLEMFIALARGAAFRPRGRGLRRDAADAFGAIKQLEDQLGVQLVWRGSRFQRADARGAARAGMGAPDRRRRAHHARGDAGGADGPVGRLRLA